MSAQQIKGAIVRVIVDHVYFFINIRGGQQIGKESFQVESGVPVKNDEGY